MAITTQAQLADALDKGTKQRFTFTKTGVSTNTGSSSSCWRGTGINPAQGAIPTTAAACSNATVGAIPFINPVSGQSTYMAKWSVLSSVVGSIELHDRLCHMGGLDSTLTTTQTVNLSLFSMLGTNNLTTRMGKADYSEVQWWIEIYSALGTTTAPTLTIAFTDQNGAAQTTTYTLTSSTVSATRALPIIPPAGLFIRSIESVTLSSSTGTAGNFGFTATIERAGMALPLINHVHDFAVGPIFGIVPDSACLNYVFNATGTTGPTLAGSITFVQG